jgi:membrane protein YqaA with SNARE-associated domain
MTDQDTPEPKAHAPFKKPHIFRRLYDWVLSWAETRYGTQALALISFAESSFFPIPPDVLQMALSVGKPKRSFYYAGVSLIASIAGAVLGWWIGRELWDSMNGFFFDYIPGFTQENFDKVGEKYNEHAFLAIFGAAFTPIPFKIFTIASGVFEVKLHTLVIASLCGRGMRFFGVGALVFFFGPSVKELIDKYFEIVALVLFVLLVGGFVAVKYLLH